MEDPGGGRKRMVFPGNDVLYSNHDAMQFAQRLTGLAPPVEFPCAGKCFFPVNVGEGIEIPLLLYRL
jgi:hypothetical protein